MALGHAGRNRAGFLAIPREWFSAVARGDITVEQLGILVLVASEGNWAAATTVLAKDGTRYGVGIGETLLGRRKFAARYGLGKGGRERVTRALRRGEALGIMSITAAEPAPPAAPSSTPPGAPPAAPPPTLVKFRNDAEILFPAIEPAPLFAPPPAPLPAPASTPIQEGNNGTTNIPSPSPAARGTRSTTKARKEPDPRHRALTDRLVAVFAELRGVPYGFHGGKDGRAVAELLRLSGGDPGAVEARWRRALAMGDRFPGCGSLSALASRWNDLATAGAARPSGIASRNAPQPPSTQFTTTFAEVS
ncbi:hypothetical protein [Anaeromyxobacter sp. Fw109-5]|uniref:hypothetical protein n=1 Tax=Anaeromyxobacter sp. (strain Fw109-5) TaxID=404589 RepID=UPI0000ED803E|nr:hypothetical protein [Anaeromyxobacter sp. Fw109-5]ABS25290.1 hypothetical protein Anae109_1082 [Anaeromyxobacter sp. Fw109-5]